MIITKTPLRISFCGGGTDLAAFYEKAGYGAVLSTSIDKFVYLAIHRYFESKFLLKYSASEIADSVEEIKHPLIRECIRWTGLKDFIEVTSFADIPSSGSGLGSSSAFSVGLIHALLAFQGKLPSKETCGAGACEVEIEKLLEPIGKQDQYAAAYGGLNYIRFNAEGSVDVEPVIMPRGAKKTLESRLCMFYTGVTRKASSILSEQKANTVSDERKFSALVTMRDQADTLRHSLAAGDLDAMGHLLDAGWQLKRELASGITSPQFDAIYSAARSAGALGGKLLGAGGGGFFLFYCHEEKQEALKQALPELRSVPFAFDSQGTRIIFVED